MADSRLIYLSSAEGQKLLHDVQSGRAGSYCQSKLIKMFTKQMSRTACGLVSCAVVLSAHSMNQSTSQSQPAYTEENMFNMPATLTVISPQKIDTNGNKVKQCITH